MDSWQSPALFLCPEKFMVSFIEIEFRRVLFIWSAKNVVYWYTVVICQNQLTIFIPTRSTTIADYSSINYLLQVSVFLAKIGILSIVSGSKKSKFNIFLYYFLLTSHMKRYLIWSLLTYWHYIASDLQVHLWFISLS